MAHDSFVVRAQAHHAASRNHSGHRLAWDAGFLPVGAAGSAEQQDGARTARSEARDRRP